MENYRLEKRTSVKSLYGIVWSVFGAGLFFLVLSVLLVNLSSGNILVGLFAGRSILPAIIFIGGFVSFIGIAFFGRRMKLWLLLTFYAISLPYFALTINLMFLAYLPGLNLIPVLGIMLIPGGVMVLMGVIGYYELINIRKLQIVFTFLLVALFISVIIGIFTRSDTVQWYIAPLGVAVMSIATAIDFFMMRHELENAQYGDYRQMVKIAAWYGIRLFFNYAILLIYLIRFIGGLRR